MLTKNPSRSYVWVDTGGQLLERWDFPGKILDEFEIYEGKEVSLALAEEMADAEEQANDAEVDAEAQRPVYCPIAYRGCGWRGTGYDTDERGGCPKCHNWPINYAD